MGEAPAPPDGTLVYLCNPEWCEDGFHEDFDEVFVAFFAKNVDVEELTNEDGDVCIPLSKGDIRVAYKMPCGTWWANRPNLMTVERARERLFAY